MVRKKKLIKERKNRIKKVFIVTESMMKKCDGYLLAKSIKRKFLVKVRLFTTAKTINMYDHLKPTLRVFNPGLWIIHVDTKNLPFNKTRSEIAEEVVNLAESVKKSTSNIAILEILTYENSYKYR